MIRKAVVSDLTALVQVQNDGGYNSWSEKQLEESLNNGLCWVLEHQGVLLGFALFSTVLDEAELLNIVLLKEYQRQGMATHLLVRALAELREQGTRYCFLEVGSNNQRAIQLYEKLGFRFTGKRENYYKTADGAEDALLMQYQLQEKK